MDDDTETIVPEAPVMGDQENTAEGDVSVEVAPVIIVDTPDEPEPEPEAEAAEASSAFDAGVAYGELLSTVNDLVGRVAVLELNAAAPVEVEEVEEEGDEETEPEDTDENAEPDADADDPERPEPKSTRTHFLYRRLSEWRS